MGVVLLRVDERLIHGQVVVGWGSQLHPDRIVVVDDEVARSSWERDLYALGAPPEIEVVFADVTEARRHFAAWKASEQRTVVLTRDLATMRRLAEAGMLAGEEINVGGIHYAPGRREVLPYVFLSDEDEEHLRVLGASGARVSARDLPGSRRVSLEELLRRSEGRT